MTWIKDFVRALSEIWSDPLFGHHFRCALVICGLVFPLIFLLGLAVGSLLL